MKVQIVACLLCLMIVGRSLDRLPDPPAVKRQRNHSQLVSQLDYRVAVAARNGALDCLACAVRFQASLFWFGQIFERRGLSYDSTCTSSHRHLSTPFFLETTFPAREALRRPILL
jgi:hypothetical protein